MVRRRPNPGERVRETDFQKKTELTGPKNFCTKQQNRKHLPSSIIFFTRAIMDHLPEFKFLATQILKSKYDPADACLTASKFFLSSRSSHPVSSPTFLQDYLQTQYKCFDFINKLQANILCSFCSPRFAQTINLQTK